MTNGQDDISFDDEATVLPWAQEDLPPVVPPAAAAGGVGANDCPIDDLAGPFLEVVDSPADPQDQDQPAEAAVETAMVEEPATESVQVAEQRNPLLRDDEERAAAEPIAELSPEPEFIEPPANDEDEQPTLTPAADIPVAQEDMFPEPVSEPPAAVPVLMYPGDPPPEASFIEDDPIPDPEPFDPGPVQGGMWTIPMLCLGIAIIACCALIPQADENRRIVYQREQLRRDLEATQKQVQVNADFLRKVAHDPNLAERLAQRQMKIVREGTRVLDLNDERETEMSPYHLTHVGPPDPLPPYRPRGGRLTQLCLDPQSRLYLMGCGLLLMAGGLVLGYAPRE